MHDILATRDLEKQILHDARVKMSCRGPNETLYFVQLQQPIFSVTQSIAQMVQKRLVRDSFVVKNEFLKMKNLQYAVAEVVKYIFSISLYTVL